MIKVMCFGTFDLLHLGHLNYFKQAKKFGDYLIVIVARDKTKEQMGKKTIFNEKERLELVQNLKIVDKAILGSLNDHFQAIKEEKPNVICLGYDQEVDETNLRLDLEKNNLFSKIERMKPYKHLEHKSSLLKKKIKGF